MQVRVLLGEPSDIAQLAERPPDTRMVIGANPIITTSPDSLVAERIIGIDAARVRFTL